MPELPEVETIARRLRSVLPGKSIDQVQVLREKSWRGNAAVVVGQKIVGVSRRSKVISLELYNKYSLMIHLKMTGQLLYVANGERLGGGHPTNDFVQELPSKHTRVVISFGDTTTLFFNDMRVFGWIKVVAGEDVEKEFCGLGPDITNAVLSASYLIKVFSRRTQAIKQVIMDNQVVAGVGNIYANDALHLAKIDPRRPALSLSKQEVARLLQAMQAVIQLGIEQGGATISHYQTPDGLTGHYQDFRRVYARENQPCPECGCIIERIKQGGRSTFYCPQCQSTSKN